jgi:hypothetical protein
MHTYIVSYDPIGPGPKLDAIKAKLSSYPKFVQALTATWFVQTDDTAFKIGAAMEQILDDDDGLIVNRVSWEAAWSASIAPDIDHWLSEHLNEDPDPGAGFPAADEDPDADLED